MLVAGGTNQPARAGRHRLQTSDALGAAAAQLGPDAVTLAVTLNKQLGMPPGKIATLWRERYGLHVTAGGLVHAVRCRPAGRADLLRAVRNGPR